MPALIIESGDSPDRAFEFEEDIVIGRGSTPDFAILDSKISRRHAASGQVKLANAGHLLPFLRRASGVVETPHIEPHPPLGIFEDVTYPARGFELRAGDTVISCTDGLNEAFSASREQFGEERIRETLEGTEGVPERALAALLRAVESFQAGPGATISPSLASAPSPRKRATRAGQRLPTRSLLPEVAPTGAPSRAREGP